MIQQIGDPDIWDKIKPDDLWIYDKLILSRKLGYLCGPAGVAPPVTNAQEGVKPSRAPGIEREGTDRAEMDAQLAMRAAAAEAQGHTEV